MGFNHNDIKKVKKEGSDEQKCTEIFVLWGKQGGHKGICDYKWKQLLKVLCIEDVGEYRLADKLGKWLTPMASNQNAIALHTRT